MCFMVYDRLDPVSYWNSTTEVEFDAVWVVCRIWRDKYVDKILYG